MTRMAGTGMTPHVGERPRQGRVSRSGRRQEGGLGAEEPYVIIASNADKPVAGRSRLEISRLGVADSGKSAPAR